MLKRQEQISILPGLIAYLLLLVSTLFAAFWGIAEFFHEGWFMPFTQFIYYMMPFLILMSLTLVGISSPRIGGILIIVGGAAFLFWRIYRLMALHYEIRPSVWIPGLVIILTGVSFFLDGVFRKRYRYRKPTTFTFNACWKQILVVFLPVLLIFVVGTPMLIHNMNRMPLANYNEITIAGNGRTLTFAGDGPGWLYSNKHPVIFKGKMYSGMSWNEIALFGMEPVGFKGKRYGTSYNGTKESIYYATPEDFNKYNMFRYINYDGTELTETLQDHWRLATVEEYITLFTHRGKNADGDFDQSTGMARYAHQPDKEGPIWAPVMEVIYYWTSTSFNEKYAYDIPYSGQPRRILKTTVQDYRGYRAVRTKTAVP